MKPENATRMAPLDWTPAMRLETYGLMAKHVPGSLAMPHTILHEPYPVKCSTESVSALGVCNFSPRQLKELLAYCTENNLPRSVADLFITV